MKFLIVLILILIFIYPTYRILDRVNVFDPGMHEYAVCRTSSWYIDGVEVLPLIYGKERIPINETDRRGSYKCHIFKSYIKPTFIVDTATSGITICSTAIDLYYIDDVEYNSCYTLDGLSNIDINGEAKLTIGHNMFIKKFSSDLCKYSKFKGMCYTRYVDPNKYDASICKKMGGLKEKCYFNYAINDMNPSLCEKTGEFKEKCMLNLNLLKENLTAYGLKTYLDLRKSKEIEAELGSVFSAGVLGREFGILHIKLLNQRPMNPEAFQLYINYNLQDADGCLEKDKWQEYCELEFLGNLKVDDVLEVVYEGETISAHKISKINY